MTNDDEWMNEFKILDIKSKKTDQIKCTLLHQLLMMDDEDDSYPPLSDYQQVYTKGYNPPGDWW